MPAVNKLPLCVDPVTLNDGNVPTDVATIPVNADPLPKK